MNTAATDNIISTPTLPITLGDMVVVPEILPQDKINAALAELNIVDTNSITSFGVSAQREVNSVSEQMLIGVKNKDVGPVAESLNKIVLNIRGLDTSDLSKRSGFFAKLFRKLTPVAEFVQSFETVESHIDTILEDLDTHRVALSRSVNLLDRLYRETEKSALALEIYIAAAQIKLRELNENMIPMMKDRAAKSDTPMATQEFNDIVAVRDRLDRKYINLQLTRTITLQNLPAIRLTQDHDVSLIEKITDIDVNTIPLWKRQIAIALEGAKTLNAAKSINATTDLTNDLIVEGAKQLGMAQIEARKAVERNIVDVDAVEAANKSIIETIGAIQTMAKDAGTKRRDAENRIAQAENSLKNAILNAA